MKLQVAMLITAIFVSCNVFSQSYVIMAKPQKEKRWGYINLKGEIIIKPSFLECFSFSDNGLALDHNPNKGIYRILNLNGEFLDVEIEISDVANVFGYGSVGYRDGFLAFKNKGKWGYLDSKGKVAVPNIYDRASIFSSGHAIVESKNKFFIIDGKGKKIGLEIEKMKGFRRFSEGLAVFYLKNGKFGYIDTNGAIVIDAQFNGSGHFINGLAWARDDEDNVGFIDTTGNWIIEPQFERVFDFEKESGMAFVLSDKGWCHVNRQGEVFRFEHVRVLRQFSDGLAFGEKKDLIGFYNNKGEWVIEPKFDAVRDFKNGYAAAKEGYLWGIIDKEGNWVLKPSFKRLKDVEIVYP
ncbi:MAG: WG repeat-containing protein [Bacteroidales bacterium]|nr:WG repeat-containing protein [Bacteroidales bacterium]